MFCRFEILQCGDIEKLIRKRQDPEESPVYYVSIEDTFDVIKRTHIATGHGGRDRMMKELNKKYANITRDAVELYKSYCQECQKKRKRPMTKGVVVRPILSKEFSSRGQVDLIDMQSMGKNSFKWILVYQDHLTKFVILRSLTSKRAIEVAHHLLDIFLLLGAPSILQSDNGSEFTAAVIQELKTVWPELVIVHGKPRHPQSQGSVERANGDIKDMLVAWMGDNNTNDWTVGIKFVQFQKNSSLHSGIQRSPYNAMFGCDAKVGLTTSSLPVEVIQQLQSEEDLQSALASTQIITQDQPTHAADNPEETEPNIDHSHQDMPVLSPEADAIQTVQIHEYDMPALSPVTGASQDHEEDNLSLLNLRQQNILTEREQARTSQRVQAERMVKRSRVDLAPGKQGDNVAVPIPLVDRGRGDPRNILGIILDIDENNMYTIAVKAGILQGKYSRNQFDLCPQVLLDTTMVNQSQVIGLRKAVAAESASGGQGFVKCNCTSAKRCQSNQCRCFKAKTLCSSRCHGSLSCKNK